MRGEELLRLHIGRRSTDFYVIVEKERVVRLFEFLPIDEKHKKYGQE